MKRHSQLSKFQKSERAAWVFMVSVTAIAMAGFWGTASASCPHGSIVEDFQSGWVRTGIENTLWSQKELAYKHFSSYNIKTGCYIEAPVVFPLFDHGRR